MTLQEFAELYVNDIPSDDVHQLACVAIKLIIRSNQTLHENPKAAVKGSSDDLIACIQQGFAEWDRETLLTILA